MSNKMVNGKIVPLSEEEEADWLLNQPTTEDILMEAKAIQTQLILDEFAKAEVIPVDLPEIGLFWADVNSALRLDGARRSVIEAIGIGMMPQGSTVPLTDTSRVRHNLILEDALVVCLTVANKSQVDFSNKQSKIVEINGAVTIEEVEAIVW